MSKWLLTITDNSIHLTNRGYGNEFRAWNNIFEFKGELPTQEEIEKIVRKHGEIIRTILMMQKLEG